MNVVLQRRALFLTLALIGVHSSAAWSQAALPAGTPATEVNPRTKKAIRWGLTAPAASKAADVPALPRATGKTRPTNPSVKLGEQDRTAAGRFVFENLTLRDEDGKVVYRGAIDVRPTLERIDADRRLGFRNDGSVFSNREGRVPRRNAGYYREWVVPTPGYRGPGPMRIVTGAQGEAFFTADHYKSFQRIR